MNKQLISGLLLATCSTAATAFMYDGKFQAGDYDRIFNVSYEYAGQTIVGGTLALATVGTTQYMYFGHPPGFHDTSYGTNAHEVGWPGSSSDVKKRWSSELFDFDLTTDDAGSPLTFSVLTDFEDPIDGNAPASSGNRLKLGVGAGVTGPEVMEKNETFATDPVTATASGALSGGGDVIVSYFSTMDYNARILDGDDDTLDLSGTVAGGDFNAHSPVTVETVAGGNVANVNCPDEASSHPDCYALDASVAANLASNYGDYLAGTPTGPGGTIDWVFQAGVEIELTRSDGELFFGDLDTISDSTTFSYKGSAPINLFELHASPPKLGAGDCPPGFTGDPSVEPCDVSVDDIPPPVPEPVTFAMLALGLGTMRLLRKRG